MPKSARRVRFTAQLFRPAVPGKPAAWTFVLLPKNASAPLASRGMTPVEGTLNGVAFHLMAEPDGNKGHWLRIDKKLREAAGAKPGDTVTLETAPAIEPEPVVPADLRKALAAAPKAKTLWSNLTDAARWDWIHWLSTAKQEKTREKRIAGACDMLAKGKKRVCCFDRSGYYDKSQSAPTPAAD